MAAKGSIAKTEIMSTILKTFPNSFAFNDGKEVRINYMENGELVQIKVTLTAAKVPVEVDIPAVTAPTDIDDVPFPVGTPAEKVPDEPSDEEKERLKSLLAALNL